MCAPPPGRQTHTLLWFATEASRRVHASFAFPSPSIVQRLSPNERSSLASCAQQSKHPRPAVMAEGDQENGERAKLANGKKTQPVNTKPARTPMKKIRSKSKAETLACRYCGSDDLAPSFSKRHDRRCRKRSANAMDRRHRRGRRKSRSSLASGERDRAEGLALFRLRRGPGGEADKTGRPLKWAK